MVQTTRDDIYAMQSQLRDRQSGVGIEPLALELETEEISHYGQTVLHRTL